MQICASCECAERYSYPWILNFWFSMGFTFVFFGIFNLATVAWVSLVVCGMLTQACGASEI
ncbi:hypothetical protein T4B_2282 [Trichinella pseudospiralis]|uniref:Uncharacterized protein n=1 Tax=Trichinella pseudospiralis TaxID=6337 RepID=A0A0V1ISY2_TRIPS|nr:hypothetical protein T4A_10927 [Trichinella pseudospiralis]KRZ09578.1 hypothetical protein T4B_2282 [Trichinella pseudospiralis]KRZ25269.1 hypothetical protein T4C_12047 [Trichinella pseudospiralis]